MAIRHDACTGGAMTHHGKDGERLTSILAQCRKTWTVRFRLDLAALPFVVLPCKCCGAGASREALPAAVPRPVPPDSLASGDIIMLPVALRVGCSLEACMLGSAGVLWGFPRALGLA